MSENAHRHPSADASGARMDTPLPMVRIPMLDAKRDLFAYEIRFPLTDPLDPLDPNDATPDRVHATPSSLDARILATLADGAINRLVRGHRVFLHLSRALLMEQGDMLLPYPRVGVIVDASVAGDEALVDRLEKLAQRHIMILVDLGSSLPPEDAAHQRLLQMAHHVRLNASAFSVTQLDAHVTALAAQGLGVIAAQVDDRDTYQRCLNLPLQAIQGRYLLSPDHVAVPVLSANRISVLRLIQTLQEENSGPVELGDIVRNDAVLSYKLLSCVNSAYFGLSREIKSVHQAAIFFGVNRMRNWVYAMVLGGMDDRPAEVLRAALIRAHMCKQLAAGMPSEDQEMAFTVGLFSLLDTLMNAPMDYVLTYLALAPSISDALLHHNGPFAPMLAEIQAWESGEFRENHSPHRIQRMASAYFEATQWADQIYTYAAHAAH